MMENGKYLLKTCKSDSVLISVRRKYKYSIINLWNSLKIKIRNCEPISSLKKKQLHLVSIKCPHTTIAKIEKIIFYILD